MTGLSAIFDYLNAGGVLAILLLLGWGFYTGRIRLGKDFDEQDEELVSCRAEIKELWQEKLADKERSAELAQAYLKIREADKQ